MNNMVLALEITALGMGLVFAAIVLLWWIMNLLTSITAAKEPVTAPQVTAAATTDEDFKAQAAAVAVAIALAEQQGCAAHPFMEPPATTMSAWQLGMRTRQMYQKGSSIRHRAR